MAVCGNFTDNQIEEMYIFHGHYTNISQSKTFAVYNFNYVHIS